MAEAAPMKCPFMHTQRKQVAKAANWWPNQLNLAGLGDRNPTAGHPAYAEEFATLDLAEVCADITKVMTTSQPWWPADYGHYGPFFIRMAWHSAGTYRVTDGRGGGGQGNLRFAPLNSWPDNVNLDKAKRLLWPVKKKYGRKLSWADMMILAGNCAIESMGLKTFGFAGGRVDMWKPADDIYWGTESEWLAADRGGLGADLEKPLGAVQMGLIYVNPTGPGGNPDPLLSAKDIRETFGRMAMNDEETVALIAGGHTFGKAHGAADADKYVGPEPEGAKLQNMGFGWTNSYKTGKGVDTISSGLEGAWTVNPTKWDNGYFDNLFKYDWVQTKSPAGAIQWIPSDASAAELVVDAHDPAKRHAPVMFTSDLALKKDPAYLAISKRFHADPDAFGKAFAAAWYKLTHRDMGPHNNLLGPLVPPPQIWQDPVPAQVGDLVDAAAVEELKATIKGNMVKTFGATLASVAWGSACTYRFTDQRGGANGARIRLEPQRNWPANDPDSLGPVLDAYTKVQTEFNAKGGAQVSLADLIVLGGNCFVEVAAAAAGHAVAVPFVAGRTDATAEMTDDASFAWLEPKADGFRNYYGFDKSSGPPAETMLVDRAQMLTLSKGETCVLVAGMRAMGVSAGDLGVLTTRPGQLTNDFLVNLLDMDTEWKPIGAGEAIFEGVSRADGKRLWTASRTDLVFGSNSELRAVAEYYACDDAAAVFVSDFAAAWSKVMQLDSVSFVSPAAKL